MRVSPHGWICSRTLVCHLMNALEIKGNWNIIKGTIQKKWAMLTENDLQYLKGTETELVGRIQKRTGETREAVEAAIMGALAISVVAENAAANPG